MSNQKRKLILIVLKR